MATCWDELPDSPSFMFNRETTTMSREGLKSIFNTEIRRNKAPQRKTIPNLFLHLILCFFLLVGSFFKMAGQDKRVQYPTFFSKAYVEVTAGYVSYPYTDKNLIPGFTTEKIFTPHVGVRLALLGYHFNDHLSAHVSYMRPVFWIYYKNVNGDQVRHTVTINIAALMLRGRLPVNKFGWIYGEAGLALLTRSGFYVNAPHVMPNANYGTFSLGSGVEFRRSKKWSLVAGMTWSPKKDKEHQPLSLSVTGGFNYSIQPIPPEKIAAVLRSPYRFPKQILQAGYTTDAFGFIVNDFFANNIIPVFWSGNVEVKRGVSVHYQHNFFHTRKVFSMDWGASAGYWKTRSQGQDFYTFSIYPLFRFFLSRRKNADIYFDYSLAGPAFISKTRMDDIETGEKFTFQDFLGFGLNGGKKKNLNTELRIYHFSNGDLFPVNNGVKVPLSFMLGYAFY
jgi:hypothetical protein